MLHLSYSKENKNYSKSPTYSSRLMTPRRHQSDSSTELIKTLGKYREILIFKQLEIILKKYGVGLQTSLENFPEEAINDIMNGITEQMPVHSDTIYSNYYLSSFEGIYNIVFIQ